VPEDGDPGGTIRVQIDTCGSNAPAKDSLLQVFQVRDDDQGQCSGLGRCAGNGELCYVAARDCADFSECVSTTVACSVAAQDCPLDASCVLDRTAACAGLSLVACNDDAVDGCGDPSQAQNSKICLPEAVRGRTYYVLVAAKSPETLGAYQVSVRQVSSCGVNVDAVANDYCPNAEPITDGVTAFDLSEATFDCPADQCLANLQNDEWFEYIAPYTGDAVIEACGETSETTPDTELIVYDGCDCPTSLPNAPPQATLCCNGFAGGTCLLGARCEIDIVAGECYKVRIGDNRGGGAAGDLSIISEPNDCNGNDIGDHCDIDCGPGGGECDVAGCGAASDCNTNGVPDLCDTRDGTSDDCNGNDVPDECEPDCQPNGIADECEIRDGDADDCQPNGIPDVCDIRDGGCLDVDPADGVCDDCAGAAVLIESEPIAAAPGVPPGGSLWRSAANFVLLTFDADIAAPGAGDVEVVEMLAGGGYGADLSANFTFTVMNDGGGDPRILRIDEVGSILVHHGWYAFRNTGSWSGVAPFETQYPVAVGDANNDRRVLFNDLGVINGSVPCLVPGTCVDRHDINGDGRVLFNDLGVANGSVPLVLPDPKPAGHP
jgi:hypothetical protein